MGISDAEMDEWGYVMATIPSNVEHSVPTICFCAHVDTAPDCKGTNVKPILHRNYQGQEIVLPDDQSQVISTSQYPYLQKKIGEDIITASGTTLLGADDKAGVTVMLHLINNNVPGLYYFFIGEEVGCIGSFQADKNFFSNVGYCVQFDCPEMLAPSSLSHRL